MLVIPATCVCVCVPHLLQLRLGVDVHVARLTVKRFVLQARGHGGRRRRQLGLDAGAGEGLDGAGAHACLQHGFVLRTWRGDIYNIIKKNV